MCQNTGDKRIPCMHVRWRQRIKTLSSVFGMFVKLPELTLDGLGYVKVTNARDVTMTRRCRICTFHRAQGSFQPTFLSGVVEEDTPYLLCHVDFESHAQALRCQVCIIINSTA